MNYKNYFNSLLVEQDLGGAPPPQRPQHPSGQAEMEDSLEAETDPNAFTPEGLPEEAIGSIVAQVSEQVKGIANELNEFNGRLINPNNPESFLSRLASKEIYAIPEFQEASEAAAKALSKAQPAIASAITELYKLVTMAENRKAERQAADAAASANKPAPY